MQRSYLYAPGHRDRILDRVATSGADAVVLDLEDGVPRDRKEEARAGVVRWLETRPDDAPETWVRIQGELAAAQADLEALAPYWDRLAGLRLPKAESPKTLEEFERRLGASGAPESLGLALLFESALGVHHASSLCAHPRVRHVALGAADFVADIGADLSDPLAIYWAESALVLASRVAGLEPPVQSVYTRLDDDEGLLATSFSGRARGFFGRSVIHPRQLDAVHRAYTPDAAEVARARALVEAADAAQGGAATLDGEFVDEALARRARRLLELADRFAPSAAVRDVEAVIR